MSAAEREALKVAREEYAELLAKYDALQHRVRAATVDVSTESGPESPQHQRLQYVLTGEGPGRPSPLAFAVVAAADERQSESAAGAVLAGARAVSSKEAQARRRERLSEAMPTDPREWWTGDEVVEFIDRWRRLGLPELVMEDADNEYLTLWCVDLAVAGEMLGLRAENGEIVLKRGRYEACIVQDANRDVSIKEAKNA